MRATIRDQELLASMRPLDVVAYLRSRGWQEAERLELGAFWTKTSGETVDELLLPNDLQSRDFIERMAEVLGALEDVEQRSQLEIIEDLSFANADVIRSRLRGAAADGTISIEDGKLAYEQARSLILAAACSALEPRELYAKRKPERAMNYLQHARFGVPKRGSYVLTIISPVSPRLITQKDLFGDVEPEEPFERRAVRTLAKALEQVAIAGAETAATGDLVHMKKAVAYGVSANLCEALVELNRCSGGRGVDFSFSWAPTRGAPKDTKSHVVVSADVMPILEETARVFRETGTEEGVQVLGTVHKLEHQTGNQGRVTIDGSVDGVPRRITLELAGEEHSLAVRSYEDRIPIVCHGELTKEGRSWVLKNPRDVSLMNTPEE